MLSGREVGVLDSVQPVVSDSEQTGWQLTVVLSVQVGICFLNCIRVGAPNGVGTDGSVLIAHSTPGCPPYLVPQVGSGGATQSVPACPLVPGRPLHIGSGALQETPGVPFVPLPLQSGFFLLVQLVSGTSESAPLHVGRVPAEVLIWAAFA